MKRINKLDGIFNNNEIFNNNQKDEREQQINNEIYSDALAKVCIIIQIFWLLSSFIAKDIQMLLYANSLVFFTSLVCFITNIKSIRKKVLGNSIRKATFEFGGLCIPTFVLLIFLIISRIFNKTSPIGYITVIVFLIIYYPTINIIYKKIYDRSR